MIRAKVLNLINSDADTLKAVFAGADKTVNHHERLRQLTVGTGQLAALLRDPGWSKGHLRRVYGFCTGWLVALGEKHTTVLVEAERAQQEELFQAGKHLFTCSSPVVDEVRKLGVLVEELGEIADAIENLEKATVRDAKLAFDSLQHRYLVNEIVQVAAVAVAWLEAKEAKQ
ncbi:MAG TPA: hypothetical protein VGO57_09565 [Verrucomicrobiae bacterium]|jgi:NTP pyrophosphatase (non-canonical NTP hydrolase)